MTAFTVILPHKRNPGNDAALRLCLDMLFTNTRSDFKLIIDAAENSPLYPRVNDMAYQADTDIIVYWASDMFAAPDWDLRMLDCYAPSSIICPTVVEPGVIAMYGGNHKRDFGRRPDSFDRAAFEAWAVGGGHNAGGDPWYAPYMISRHAYIGMGGLDSNVDAGLEFGGADMAFFELWKQGGRHVVRAPGCFVYHLQRWSDVEEQMAEKRT